MNPLPATHPVLDCAAAARFEAARFDGEPEREWPAMRAAGIALTRAMLADLRVTGIDARSAGRIVVLVGKGHNGGDALLAAAGLLEHLPRCTVEVGFVFGQNRLRPLTLAAWRHLQAVAGDRVRAVRREAVVGDGLVLLDGVFGFQFRPPLADAAAAWLAAAAGLAVRLRAAVDLPSGLGEPGAFVADATYATGILKAPLLDLPNAGRLRYLDLGFFHGDEPGTLRVLTPAALEPLKRLRRADADKRSFGHLVVIGGSRRYPGAVAMTVAAALHSGAGLVTAFVPESLAPALAAAWPEAMWVGCAETPEGGISLDAGPAVRAGLARATALVIGPGLGRDPETLALVADLLRGATPPLVLDADALQPDLVGLGRAPRILTPHAGEWARIAPTVVARPLGPDVVVRKGPVTRIQHQDTTWLSLAGGPVLARGGSGDLLAGLIGGRLAAAPAEPLLAAAQGVCWHGRAAERLAERRGETAVRVTALLDELSGALREEST